MKFKNELLRNTADLESQIEESKAAVKAKSDFLSKMSHEIRTPLNAIMGMIQIVQHTTDLDEISGYTEKMESSSRHLLGIINNILDLSKIESGNFVFKEDFFSLTSNIEFVASIFAEKAAEKNIDLEIKAEGIRHDGIVADKLRLNQVLINLMGNALKFTDKGGAVELSAEELFYMDGEGAYRFTVKDNGIGIETEQAKKLFTPFTQAHSDKVGTFGGTGLGLAISQNIVQMMGGDILLDTEYGKGSTFQFTIRVPAMREAEAPDEDKPVEIAPGAFSGNRVLVVDDNALNLHVASSLLKIYGVSADTAESGMQAIKMIQQTKYDFVFMDYIMPGLDGIETTKAIRELGICVPIVALTANTVEGQRETMLKAGMNDYLSKPIVMEELWQILTKWLTAKPPGQLAEAVAQTQPEDETDRPLWHQLEQINGLDVSIGLKRAGGQRCAFLKSLRLLIQEAEKCKNNLDRFLAAENMESFRIEVHGIKGALASIGAIGLSEKAYELETASRENDVDACSMKLPTFFEGLGYLSSELEKASHKASCDGRPKAIPPELPPIFKRLSSAFREIDFDGINTEVNNLSALGLTGALKEGAESIVNMVMVMDYDRAEEQMRKLLMREV
ncbi:MAG: ATP-binding protein [Clostridiales bacterium]|nr:ATP-binding protein [Clostridiales bacterium]